MILVKWVKKKGPLVIQILGNEIKKKTTAVSPLSHRFYQQEINPGANSVNGRHMRKLTTNQHGNSLYCIDILIITSI